MAVLCLHVPQLLCRNHEGQITSAVSGLMHIRLPRQIFHQVNADGLFKMIVTDENGMMARHHQQQLKIFVMMIQKMIYAVVG